jgi:hypothetical protein
MQARCINQNKHFAAYEAIDADLLRYRDRDISTNSTSVSSAALQVQIYQIIFIDDTIYYMPRSPMTYCTMTSSIYTYKLMYTNPKQALLANHRL